MLKQLFAILLILLSSCKVSRQLVLPERKETAPGGNAFYKQITAMKWKEREPIMIKEILSGNVPEFLKKLVPVHIEMKDTSGEIIATSDTAPDLNEDECQSFRGGALEISLWII